MYEVTSIVNHHYMKHFHQRGDVKIIFAFKI
jgi:hypothetical protein